MSTSKTAWVQLYQARQIPVDITETRTPGRPPSPIPRKKVGLTLSDGETKELEVWQKRLSDLMGRKISIGETVGILTRIATGRLARLNPNDPAESLVELVEKMIG